MDGNAVEVLYAEHRQLEELFNRVSGPDEDRAAVLKEVMKALANHMAVEKQLLTPLLRDQLDDGDAIADRLGDSHDRVEHIMTLLERRKVNSPDVPDLVNDLVDITAAHIADANDSLFPALRNGLSADQLDELGRRIVSDERTMVTHSHPTLPDEGPLAGIASKAAEFIDGVRDRSVDLGKTDN